MDELEKYEQSLPVGVVAYQPQGKAAEAAVYKYGPKKYACVLFKENRAWGDTCPINMILHLQRNKAEIPEDRKKVLFEILKAQASKIAEGLQ